MRLIRPPSQSHLAERPYRTDAVFEMSVLEDHLDTRVSTREFSHHVITSIPLYPYVCII